ncbi:hypothetical protein TYRP_021354 [Tyrophagus putrescentiae]|nr:hypothetical protein TYRP_021354 [Tyrophagus putrescentiae]
MASIALAAFISELLCTISIRWPLLAMEVATGMAAAAAAAADTAAVVLCGDGPSVRRSSKSDVSKVSPPMADLVWLAATREAASLKLLLPGPRRLALVPLRPRASCFSITSEAVSSSSISGPLSSLYLEFGLGVLELEPFPPIDEEEAEVGEPAEPAIIEEECCGEEEAEVVVVGGVTKTGKATTEEGPTTRGALPVPPTLFAKRAALLLFTTAASTFGVRCCCCCTDDDWTAEEIDEAEDEAAVEGGGGGGLSSVVLYHLKCGFAFMKASLYWRARSSGPPLSENLGDGAVLQVRVLLADHRAVALAEDEKGVHRPLLRLLTGHGARVGGGGRRQ